jgi:hypothetical protein
MIHRNPGVHTPNLVNEHHRDVATAIATPSPSRRAVGNVCWNNWMLLSFRLFWDEFHRHVTQFRINPAPS